MQRNLGQRKVVTALLCAVPVVAVLAGCGGGNGGGPVVPPGTNLLALTSTGTDLLSFSSSTPGTVASRAISLPAGVTLRAIDTRVAPLSAPSGNGTRGVYGLGSNNQLYLLNTAGAGAVTATVVGAPFSFTGFTPAGGSYGFDFNPVPDRIRVVNEADQNFRLDPNTGAAVDSDANPANGINPDGTLAYDATDVNAGQNPSVVAAAYTNNDSDAATGTVNYAIDSGRDVLVTQGRPDNPATAVDETVSPNEGRLFTVGALGVNVTSVTGFEILGGGNTAIAALSSAGGTSALYSINLQTGRATRINSIGTGQVIRGLTVAP